MRMEQAQRNAEWRDGKTRILEKTTTTKLCAPDPAVPEVKKSTLGLPTLKISSFFMLKPL